MKVSVSLPADDVAFLDDYARHRKNTSRSSVIHEAIAVLRSSSLEDSYIAAWNEWDRGEDTQLWERAIGDGIVDDAAR